jgi:hypothetical protein
VIEGDGKCRKVQYSATRMKCGGDQRRAMRSNEVQCIALEKLESTKPTPKWYNIHQYMKEYAVLSDSKLSYLASERNQHQHSEDRHCEGDEKGGDRARYLHSLLHLDVVVVKVCSLLTR